MYRNYVRIQLPLKVNSNHLGNMYASSVLALAEISCGSVLVSHFGDKVLKEFSIIITGVDLKFSKIPKEDVYVDLTIPEEELEDILKVTKEKQRHFFGFKLQLTEEEGGIIGEAHAKFGLAVRKSLRKPQKPKE